MHNVPQSQYSWAFCGKDWEDLIYIYSTKMYIRILVTVPVDGIKKGGQGGFSMQVEGGPS